jgi:hypothetical protein
VSQQAKFGSSRGGILSALGKVPWTFLVIAYPVIMYQSHTDMAAQIQFGFIYIGIGVFVLFVEFFKSGDINSAAFLLDLFWSVVALVLTSALMTYFLVDIQPKVTESWQEVSPFHWFGCAIVLGDAIISPFNSFRTALRNLGLGVSA